MESPTLNAVQRGEKVIVEEISDRELSIQLCSLGCFPGEQICLERIAPLGDPMIISVEDSFISIRKADAAKIKVKKITT